MSECENCQSEKKVEGLKKNDANRRQKQDAKLLDAAKPVASGAC